VGNEPVDMGPPGNVALRIDELAKRGGSMPKAARDLIKRTTDPEMGDVTFNEARDFYSNISRLSARDYKRLTPVVQREIGNLREAMNKVIEAAAKRGGQDQAYREAMREYAVASKIANISRNLGDVALKAGATAAGAGALYGGYKAVVD
jgi:hypothetical protein